MSDPVTLPTDQTGPLDAGHTTTEYGLSKAVVILASVISVLGMVSGTIEKITAIIPAGTGRLGMWVAITSAIVGGLTAVAYAVQRGLIKIAAIKAGQTTLAAGSTDPASAASKLAQ